MSCYNFTGNFIKFIRCLIPMKLFKIYRSEPFDEQIEKMPSDFKIWVEKVETQLMQNPYVGKPLSFKWFREKKYGKFRVYYLIYENLDTVYIVALSDKKDQQKTINTIKLFLNTYKKQIEEIGKKQAI